MSCNAFEQWLDDGRPAEGRAAAEVHAAGCEACARQLRAMDELEELLSARFAAAPAAFTDRVMAGLPERRRIRPALPDPDPDLPWWVRLFQEPLVAASLTAAALLMAGIPALSRLAADWTPHAHSLLQRGAGGLGALNAAASGSLIVPGLFLLAAAGAPLLVRAAAAVAGDPAPDGDL